MKDILRSEKGQFINGDLSKNRPWCVNPFDPSLYEWKPTKKELKNLERIMLEEGWG